MLLTNWFKRLYRIWILIPFILVSCVSSPKLNQPKKSKIDLIKRTEPVKVKSIISSRQIRQKLNRFKKALQKGKLSKNDWKLHDQLLNEYIDLKSRQANKIVVPARSRVTLPLETYCLNLGKASPSRKEVYHWQKSSPGIKYYNKLLSLRRSGEIK